MLEVVTAATTNDLTVLATLKTELSITDSANDAYLADLIRQASDAIAAECRRSTWGRESLRQTEWNVYRDCIILDRDLRPVVSSVTEDDSAAAAADYFLDGSLLYRLSAGMPTQWSADKVVIVYAAGFTLLTDLPYDLERACLETCKAWWHGKGDNPLIRQETADGVGSVTYFDQRTGRRTIPATVLGDLERYTDRAIAR